MQSMKKSVFLLSAVLLMRAVSAPACTNLIVTKGASADGSLMTTYAADSHQLYGALKSLPAADYPDGTMLSVYEWDTGRYLGEIPQASHTYAVIGNMNEHQLVIGETTYGGREYIDSTAIIDYGSLIYIALQRCRTAREAIALIDELTGRYGYASEGETFTIADTQEVWMMDIIGKAPKYDKKGVNVNKGAVWVARRIPDGYISGHANQSRISKIDFNDPENCLYAKDVITHAREQGIFDGKDEDFSFCDVYNPLDFGTVRGCDARVWAFFNRFAEGMDKYVDYAMGYNFDNRMPLYVRPDHKITVKELADMMRDHYEGTPMDMTTDIGAGGSHSPYRWRPMEFEYEGHSYINERAIATQQTGWWYVAQCRPEKKCGGIFWFGVDDAATSPLMPFFPKYSVVPECLSEDNGSIIKYSDTSMFWAVNRIAQFAYLRYDRIGAEVRKVIDEYENDAIKRVSEHETMADIMIGAGESRLAGIYLDLFCTTNAKDVLNKWKELDKYLLVKYMDGNIKKQNEDGSFSTNGYSDVIPEFPIQEDYSDKWKENVIRDNGDELRIPD